MKKLLMLLLGLPLLLTSCAIITNKKQYGLTIYSNKPNSKAIVNDSIYNLPAKVTVARSKDDLKVKLITDSITKDYTVKSSPNAAFVYGNLLWMQLLPAAYAIDLNTQKRFYYGHKLELNDSDTIDTIVPRLAKGYINYFSKTYPTQKGEFYFTASVPFANHFLIRPHDEPHKAVGGFFGIAAGFEYFYKDNKFIELKGSYAIDFELPFPAPIDHWSSYERVRATTITLTDNIKFRRFTLGYGLNYTNYSWEIVNDDYEAPFPVPGGSDTEDLRAPVKKKTHAFGFTLNGYHQITKGFFAGIVYSPTFLTTFPSTKRQYQHLIGFDLVYKLQLQ